MKDIITHIPKWTAVIALMLLLLPANKLTSAPPNESSMEYYEAKVIELFEKERWEEGKQLLDKAIRIYPEASPLNGLAGRYYYHLKQYDNARYFLIKAVRNNSENVRDKQILINLEEETGNFSSAICYVNELLEITPYRKGLWRRKIGLYRRQGNDVEADRLLKRLHHIFPDDKEVTKDYEARLEENYLRYRKEGKRDMAIANLQELILQNDTTPGYYLELSNLLLQEGRKNDALDVVEKGLSVRPDDTPLAVKKAGILADAGRHTEALTFIRQQQSRYPDPALTSFYNNLLETAAQAQQLQDPYILYTQVYAKRKSDEALDYLINTATTRGYNEEALYYIEEAKKKRGNTFPLLYKEYIVHKRMGNDETAFRLLEQLYNDMPEDYDLATEMANIRLKRGTALADKGLCYEAIPELSFTARYAPEEELKMKAWNQLYTCYERTRQYAKAETALDTLHQLSPAASRYMEKKAALWMKAGQADKAMDLLETDLPNGADTYEEAALTAISQALKAGATPKAVERSRRLLAVRPYSADGLRYAITASALAGDTLEEAHYVAKARQLYPSDTTFALKQAAVYYRQKRYNEAINLLRPALDSLPDNRSLVSAYAASASQQGDRLLKEKQPHACLALTDEALNFDPDNGELALVKGRAYEQLQRPDSAYWWQKRYQAGPYEMAGHRQHLRNLLNRTYRNELAAEYLYGRYGEEDIITSVSALSYSRKMKKSLLTVRINYSGRSGNADTATEDNPTSGGSGIQLGAEWQQQLNKRWTLGAGIAWANKYFPSLSAQIFAQCYLNSGWDMELKLGIRKLDLYTQAFRWDETVQDGPAWIFDHWDCTRSQMLNLTWGTTKNWDHFSLTGRCDAYWMENKPYANLSLQARYYPLNDGHTYLSLMASAGSAPEADIIDYAMPGSFDRLNTSAGIGGMYMFTSHITLGLTGTCHNFFSQSSLRTGGETTYLETVSTNYKNLLNLYVHLLFSF